MLKMQAFVVENCNSVRSDIWILNDNFYFFQREATFQASNSGV